MTSVFVVAAWNGTLAAYTNENAAVLFVESFDEDEFLDSDSEYLAIYEFVEDDCINSRFFAWKGDGMYELDYR